MDMIIHQTKGPEGNAVLHNLPFNQSEVEGLIFIRKKDPEASVPSLDEMMWATWDYDAGDSRHGPIPLHKRRKEALKYSHCGLNKEIGIVSPI
jgi:hypothetical protein